MDDQENKTPIRKFIENRQRAAEIKRLGEESRRKALEQIMLYAGSGDRKIYSTFAADGRNTFDLRSRFGGTIFRIQNLDRQGKPSYNWFVLGEEHSEGVFVHRVFYKSAKDADLATKEFLILKPSLAVKLNYMKQTTFKIEDSIALLTDATPLVILNTLKQISKLDIMQGGVAKKATQKSFTNLRSLVPALAPKPNK